MGQGRLQAGNRRMLAAFGDALRQQRSLGSIITADPRSCPACSARARSRTDRDAHDRTAAYSLAMLPDGGHGGLPLGSTRLIREEPARAGFRSPRSRSSSESCPRRLRKRAVPQRVEVARIGAEAVQGIVIGGLLTPLGLIQAISAFVYPSDGPVSGYYHRPNPVARSTGSSMRSRRRCCKPSRGAPRAKR